MGFDIVFGPRGQQPDEAALLSLVPECVGWIAGVEPVSEAVIDSAPMLRAVSRNGVGVDNLPVKRLKERGIAVLTADGANAGGRCRTHAGPHLLRASPRARGRCWD